MRSASIRTFLVLCLATWVSACTNFGASVLPGHADIWKHMNEELSPVALAEGGTVVATRHGGGGPLLWIYCEDPSLVQCQVRENFSVVLRGDKQGRATAFYLSGDDRFLPGCPVLTTQESPELSSDDTQQRVAEVRRALQGRREWLAQYAYMLDSSFAGSGKENYERTRERWQHVLDLDVERCTDLEACNAWARGESIARFELTVTASNQGAR
jgi:hypothetical protein